MSFDKEKLRDASLEWVEGRAAKTEKRYGKTLLSHLIRKIKSLEEQRLLMDRQIEGLQRVVDANADGLTNDTHAVNGLLLPKGWYLPRDWQERYEGSPLNDFE